MKKLRLAGLIMCIGVCSIAPAYADAVTYWNSVTVMYVSTGGAGVPVGRAGPPGLLDIAVVQAAVHDAVQAIEGKYEPYLYSDPTKRGVGSPSAAAAAAAHRALVLIYPSQQTSLDTLYNAYLTANLLTGNPGLAVGEAAAAALFTQYRPTVPTTPFFGGTGAGEWRPTTPSVPMAFLALAFTTPFTMTSPSQYRPSPPDVLNTAHYRYEFDEVKKRGSAAAHPNSTTERANFWSVNFVAQWNEALRGIADTQLLDVGRSARLLALASLSAADSAIAVWDSKYHYNFWRPITAIREGHNDGNSQTAGDVTWTPFLPTPPYPDHVSGANGLTGAFTQTLRNFFGSDNLEFVVKTTSPLVAQSERKFTRISDAAQEVVEARIDQGIHFRTADARGRSLGQLIAFAAYEKILRPVRRVVNEPPVSR